MMTDTDKIRRCLKKALTRAGFIVLSRRRNIPQREEDLGELKKVYLRILTHADKLGWIVLVSKHKVEMHSDFEEEKEN